MSLLRELQGRNVFRAGIAYLIASGVLAQVVGLVLDKISAPGEGMQVTLGPGFLQAGKTL